MQTVWGLESPSSLPFPTPATSGGGWGKAISLHPNVEVKLASEQRRGESVEDSRGPAGTRVRALGPGASLGLSVPCYPHSPHATPIPGWL